jgi:tetratricopeptide (TPR) repeat protein
MRSLVLRKSDLEKLYLKNKKTPQFPQLADCYIEEGDLEKAIEICETGLVNYPDNPTAHYILGKCYYLEKRYKDAKSELERCIKYYPAFINAYKLLIEINKLDGLNQVVENLKHDMYLYSPLLKGYDAPNQMVPEQLEEVDSGFEVVEKESATPLEDEALENLITENTNEPNEKDEFLDDFDLGDLNEKNDPVAEELGMISDNESNKKSTKKNTDDFGFDDINDESEVGTVTDIDDSETLLVESDTTDDIDQHEADEFEMISQDDKTKKIDTINESENQIDDSKYQGDPKEFFEMTEKELFEDDSEHLAKLESLKEDSEKKETFRYDELNDEAKNEDIFSEEEITELDDESFANEAGEVIEHFAEEADAEEDTKTENNERINSEPVFIESKVHRDGEAMNVKSVEEVLEHVDKKGKTLKPKNSDDDLLEDELSILQSETTNSDQEDSQGIVSSTLGEIYLAQGQFKEALDVFSQLLEKEPENEKLKRKIKDISALL